MSAPRQSQTPLHQFPGRHNVHAVGRVDLHVQGRELAQAARVAVVLPNIVLHTNPTVGITNIPAWYWVDRSSYDGHVIVQPLHQEFPWYLEWTETVHHQDPCPTAEDPDKTCGSDSEEPHSETHLDTVDVTDALDPGSVRLGLGRRHSVRHLQRAGWAWPALHEREGALACCA